MKLEVGTNCWIPDQKEGWISVIVQSKEYSPEHKKYRIELVSDGPINESYAIEVPELNEKDEKLPKLKNTDDTVDDLTALPHLNEPSVLNSVKLRYQMKKIYTFSGIVLVAVNPFDRVDYLYTQEVIKSYHKAGKSDNPPHVFSIAEESFKLMKKNQQSQSIIVSGESGAGKTVSAKYIMRFFASVHHEGASINITEIEKQILATNPIMESFGNAKTTRNDNSSRFGKYLEISFDNKNLICGARIQTFLLERSRLVYQDQNERNYHIFYQMVSGLEKRLKNKLYLTRVQDYHYLNQGQTASIEGVDDVAEFKLTREALKVIGIDKETQFEIFKVMAGLLHLGNVEIENSRNEAFLSSDNQSLQYACDLLGFDHKEFGKCLVKKKIVTRSDSISSNMKYHEAIVARDSISKYIYSLLFDWIVEHINQDLYPPEIEAKSVSFIGVLDIYGFEHFFINSFEQFCINYANEKLQQQFTHHVFKLQQEEYTKEGIEWSFITFQDNQPCIDVIENRNGILSLLDEQCRLPSGSDQAWAEKMFHSLTVPPFNKVFKKGRFGNDKFVVSHYALDVTYDIKGFLEKNRDTVSDVQNKVLESTKNKFLQSLINSKLVDGDLSTSANDTYKRESGFNRNKRPTLSHMFKNSLNQLVAKLGNTNAHYIRCIKPNEAKSAWTFDNLMVLSQLRACGVLETIRISLVGFPSKYCYDEFIERFVVLLDAEDEKKVKRKMVVSMDEKKKISSKLLRSYVEENALFQLGRTKIFFRAGVLGQLEIAKSNKIFAAATTIQKYGRCHFERIKWLLARRSTIDLQSLIRGFLSRLNQQHTISMIVRIQAITRGFVCRRKTSQLISKTTLIQSYIRRYIVREEFVRLVDEHKKRVAAMLETKNRLLAEEKKEEANVFHGDKEKFVETYQGKGDGEREKILVLDDQLEQRTHSQAQNASPSCIFKSSDTSPNLSEDLPVSFINFDALSQGTERSIHKVEYNEDVDKMLEAWNLICESLPPQRYTYDDLLGMKPYKALCTISRFLIQKIRVTNTRLNEVLGGETIKSKTLNDNLQRSFSSDVLMFKKTMRRLKYVKPEAVSKRHSIRSISGSPNTNRSSSQQSIQTMSSFDRSYKSALADISGYQKGTRLVTESVAQLVLEDIRPIAVSALDEDDPDDVKLVSVDELLYHSRLISEILTGMWSVGMYNESAMFLMSCFEIIEKEVQYCVEKSDHFEHAARLITNLHDLNVKISNIRTNIMQDLNTKLFGGGVDRSKYLKILSIVRRFTECFFAKMYTAWMDGIRGEIQKIAPDALALDDTYFAIKKTPHSYFRHAIQKGSKYKMYDVVRLVNNLYVALNKNRYEKPIVDSIIKDLLKFMDIICFNDIMMRSKYLNVEKSTLIKSNITLLLDWCANQQIPDAPGFVMHLLTLCQILQLKKHGLSDVDQITSVCTCLTPSQIKRIVGQVDKQEERICSYSTVGSTPSFDNTLDSSISDTDFLIAIDYEMFENKILDV